MPNPICPKHEELSAYLVGNLDDERTSHVTSHVDDCPECQATVADLAEVAGTLISSLRGPLPEDPYESEAECRDVIALVEDFGRDPSRFGDSQDSEETPDEAGLGHVREYELLAELGRGGMGTVYKALHTKLGKVVALKVLPAEKVRHADAVARFEREMKAVGALDHPHIVRATDAGEADGVHYLVMEYVPGVDLSSVLKRHGPMRVADACEVARQAAVGLAHAHEHGLIHRDVKPSNLILSNSGQVKILDLGLALLSSQVTGEGGELTSSGQMMGTLDYMAPEQGGDSHEVDARADVYSLGATLYKLLSGEAPFAGKKYDTPMKKIVALASQTPPIAERRADLPEPLTAIVDRMLAKDPQARLATAQEIVDVLAPFAEGHRLPGLVEALPKGPAAPEETVGSTAPQRVAEQIDTTSLLPSQPAAASASSGRRYRRPAVALAAGLAAAIALGMLIRIATDNGELVIESTVADVEMLVKRVGRAGRTMEVEQGTKRTTIRSGEYEITLTGARADELRIEGDKFTMVRGGEAIVRISRVTPGSVAPESVEPESIASAGSEAWPLGPADNVLPGLIARPAQRPGIGRWQLETVGPRSEILSAAFSPDGRLLALGTHRGLVRIYDSKTRKLVRLLMGHTDHVSSVAEDRVTSVAWRHDGRQLASGDYGGTVRVWDVDGALVRTFSKRPSRVYSVAWHPEGKRLAWGGEGGIRISEVDAIPQPFSQDYKTTVNSIAWSPDGRQLASAGGDKTVRLWNADGTPAGVFEGHEARVSCVAWSPDGQQLASACGGDKTVRLWSKDGDAGPVLTGWAGAASVAWSPDGEKVVATCQSDVQLWKKDGTKEHVAKMGQNLNCVAWRPDGNGFIAVGHRGCVETLDFDGEVETFIGGHPAHIGSCVTWSPDGETLAATHDERVWQWSRDGEFKTQFMVGGYGAGHPDWHPSGDRIATGHADRMVRLWNADGKGKPMLEIEGRYPRWSPDGQWLAVSVSTAVELWDQDGTKAKTFEASPDAKIKAIAWSPDGKWLAAGGDDGKIRLWSPEGQLQHIFDEHERAIYWLAWSHDSKWLASATHNQTVCVHNVDGTAGPLLEGHVHAVLSVAWSPDDKRLAATNGHAVSLWEADGAPGPVLEGHSSLVHAVDFNPKTGTLASSGDNTVRLWDGSTGEPKMTIVMLHDDRSATFSAAGQLLDGDPAALADDFVYLVERPDGRMELRSRLDAPAQALPEEPAAADARELASPPTVPTLPDQQRPFLVIRGEAREAHEHLSEALAVMQKGDVIEVHGNGPFLLDEPIDVTDKGLVLRAASGYRPRFVNTTAGASESFFVNCPRASLEMTGCDFEFYPRRYQLMQGGGQPWSFRNCRFYLNGTMTLLVYEGPRLVISDCLVWKSGPGYCAGVTSSCDVIFENNVFVVGAVLGLPGGGHVSLKDNTVIAGNLISSIQSNDQGPTRIEAERNLFDVRMIVDLLAGGLDELQWQGHSNLFAGIRSAVHLGEGGEDLGIGLDAWGKLPKVIEEDSREVAEAVYQWDVARRAQADEALGWLAEKTKKLRGQYDRPKLGPDWQLVGAGDAYVRALAADGQAVPEDKLRPQAPLAGAFVVLHEGEINNGYPTLQKAIGAAADGDVVEIRTDGPFGGASVDSPTGRLTIRAAPGYRPVFDGSIEMSKSQGTQLSVEGIDFQGGRIFGYAHQTTSRVVRVANCTFNGPPTYADAYLVGPMAASNEGPPAEIVNCLIPRPVLLDMSAGQKLIVRNSVVAGFEHEPLREGVRDMELDRSLIWSPGLTIRGHRGAADGTIAVTARDTLFETGIAHPGALVTRSRGSISAWQGSGNVYRLGNRSWLVQSDPPVLGLEPWQKHWQSDADSIEAPPLDYDVRQWQLLPNSPGYGPGPNGEPAGADVTRIGRMTEPSTEQP